MNKLKIISDVMYSKKLNYFQPVDIKLLRSIGDICKEYDGVGIEPDYIDDSNIESGEICQLNKYPDGSKSDLTNLKNALQFVSEFNIEIYEAIKVIDELHKMNWEQIEEWRTHLITNYSTTKLEDFTLRLIDRYCSNVD